MSAAAPTNLPELFDALRRTCQDYKIDWSQGHGDNAIVDAIVDHIGEQESQAEAAGLLA